MAKFKDSRFNIRVNAEFTNRETGEVTVEAIAIERDVSAASTTSLQKALHEIRGARLDQQIEKLNE